jgi:hypothetical protein
VPLTNTRYAPEINLTAPSNSFLRRRPFNCGEAWEDRARYIEAGVERNWLRSAHFGFSPPRESKPTDQGYGNSFQRQTQGESQTASTGVSAIFASAPTLSQSTPLWFFGIENTPPATFTLGNIQTTIYAPTASSGSYFSWTITSSSGAASFANG